MNRKWCNECLILEWTWTLLINYFWNKNNLKVDLDPGSVWHWRFFQLLLQHWLSVNWTLTNRSKWLFVLTWWMSDRVWTDDLTIRHTCVNAEHLLMVPPADKRLSSQSAQSFVSQQSISVDNCQRSVGSLKLIFLFMLGCETSLLFAGLPVRLWF